MKKQLLLIGFIIVLPLSLVLGQDSTPEVSPEPTAEVTPEGTPEATVEATSEATAETTAAPEGTPETTDAATQPAPEATAEATLSADTDTVPMGEGQIIIVHEGLFPEGIEYDSLNERFLVSSVTEGTVYAVADDGTLTPLIEDERISSSIGLEVDEAGNRLLVAVTDLEKEGYLGIYDLTSGENLAFVDFKPLLPGDPEHFVNDVAVDAQGNAYVTDSYAGVIYQVDPAGNAVVFLEDETFSTQFALNGIAYHEVGNYLVAVRVPGLIKIPLDGSGMFTEVQMDQPIGYEDGIAFLDDNTLIVVSNNPGSVHRLESDDDFASVQQTGLFETGLVNPTTAAVRDGEVYVLYALLNQEEQTVSEFPIQPVTFEE